MLGADDPAKTPVLEAIKHPAIGGMHIADDMRQHRNPAIGEGHIGRHHLKGRHFRRAERNRGIGLQLRQNAEPMRGIDDITRAIFEAKAHGDSID